ncbi:MAG: hypothetical protein ACXVB6_11815, partial [Mucilaginibacter sp.]
MKRPYLIPILVIASLFCSCHSNEVKLLENGPKFSVNKGKKEVIDFGDPSNGADVSGVDANKSGALNGQLNLAGTASASAFSKKMEPLVITEDLPRSYKQRKFINNVSEISY